MLSCEEGMGKESTSGGVSCEGMTGGYEQGCCEIWVQTCVWDMSRKGSGDMDIIKRCIGRSCVVGMSDAYKLDNYEFVDIFVF